MEPVDSVEEEEGADALVEVFAAAAKRVQRGALLEQIAERQSGARLV
jgi:hypothetical protein